MVFVQMVRKRKIRDANEVVNMEIVIIIDCKNVFIVFSSRYAFSMQIFCLIFFVASVKQYIEFGLKCIFFTKQGVREENLCMIICSNSVLKGRQFNPVSSKLFEIVAGYELSQDNYRFQSTLY